MHAEVGSDSVLKDLIVVTALTPDNHNIGDNTQQ